MRNTFWRPNLCQRRDRHLEAAAEFLHLVVRNLELAAAAACDMGDAALDTDLRVCRERYLHPLTGKLQAHRYQEKK
jgi:hypothetical protein